MQDESRKFDKPRSMTCCVAGHRKLPDDKAGWVKQELRREVEQAIEDGYLYFVTDFMEGTDQLFAEVVKEIREEASSGGEENKLRLEAALPYRGWVAKLMDNEKTKPLVAACTDIGVLAEKYSPGCYMACRRVQLKRSSRMIAVYDGQGEGGTVKAIRMAHAQQVSVRIISLDR